MRKEKTSNWQSILIVLLVIILIATGVVVFYFVQKDLISDDNQLNMKHPLPAGEIFSLKEGYARGWILKEDLLNIAYQYDNRANQLGNSLNNYDDISPIQYSKNQLDDDIALKIRETVAYDLRNNASNPDKEATPDNITIVDYYGKYNVFYVVSYNTDHDVYSEVLQEEQIGGVKIAFPSSARPVLWKFRNQDIQGVRGGFRFSVYEDGVDYGDDYVRGAIAYASHHNEFDIDDVTLDLYFAFANDMYSLLENKTCNVILYTYQNNDEYDQGLGLVAKHKEIDDCTSGKYTFDTEYYQNANFRVKLQSYRYSEKLTIPKAQFVGNSGQIAIFLTNLEPQELVKDKVALLYGEVQDGLVCQVIISYEKKNGAIMLK